MTEDFFFLGFLGNGRPVFPGGQKMRDLVGGEGRALLPCVDTKGALSSI